MSEEKKGCCCGAKTTQRAEEQKKKLVNRLKRTLILPMVACPAGVNRTHCNICAIDDTCCYGFQNRINFHFKARVALCCCGEA